MRTLVKIRTLSGNLAWVQVGAVAQVLRVPAGDCGECGGRGKGLVPLGVAELVELSQAQAVTDGKAQGILMVNGQLHREAPCGNCGGKGKLPVCWGVVLLNGTVHPVEPRYARRVIRAMERMGQLPGDGWKNGKPEE